MDITSKSAASTENHELGYILREAHRLVTGDRNDQYGDPCEAWPRIAGAFVAITGIELTPAQCALIRVLEKLVREQHKHKADNLIDVAGMTAVMARVTEL